MSADNVSEQLRAAIQILEQAAANRTLLAEISPEEYSRLLKAAGNVFLPDAKERRRFVKTRIRQLRDHHEERCGAISNACRTKPLTASDMVPLIFHRPLDAHQAGFATGEVIAHINYMLAEGRLTQEISPDGVMTFKAA